MSEKPELKPYLESLRRDLRVNEALFRTFATHVVEEGISEYPVFIAAGTPVSLGKPFLSREEHDVSWYYGVTIVEDLIRRGIVERERSEEFMIAFGDPMERACVFFILGDEGKFVFIPYGGK